MPTYLYCLRSDADEPPDGLTGVDGGEVRAIDAAGIVAWVSDVSDTVSATIDRMKAHDAVCAAALAAGETPLPVRFGQTFRDDSTAVSELESRNAPLRARLARIAGCVELRIIVTAGRDPVSDTSVARRSQQPPLRAEAPHDEGGPGTAFLKRLARQGRADLAREVVCEDVRRAIRSTAKSLIIGQHPCESSRGVSFFPVLIRRADVDAFRSALAEMLTLKAIGLSVLGPFAPYSFAGDA
jgi:gas vesicle protein GvpL/GvpF